MCVCLHFFGIGVRWKMVYENFELCVTVMAGNYSPVGNCTVLPILYDAASRF